MNKPRARGRRTARAGKRKARLLLEGGRFRVSPAWRLFRLYSRGGSEHIPQMSDFFLPQMGDVLTEGVCFDTSPARGNGVESNREFAAGATHVRRPQFSGQAIALPTTMQAVDEVA